MKDNLPKRTPPPLGPHNHGLQIIEIGEEEGETDTTIRPISETLRKQLEAHQKRINPSKMEGETGE